MSTRTAIVLAVLWIALARLHQPAASRSARLARHPASEIPETRARPVVSRPTVTRRVVVVGLVAVLVTVLAGPVLGATAAAGPALVMWRRRGRQDRLDEVAVVDELPEVIDLLSLGVGAGLTVTDAMASVARWANGPVGAAIGRAHRLVHQGTSTADALEMARGDCGPPAEGLFSALIAADRYGTPVADALARLGHEARLDRRRAAEERARKVPVQLLFPLVVCVLPAFGLLTVVPLLVNSLGALA